MDLILSIIQEENISDAKPINQNQEKTQNIKKIRKPWDFTKLPVNSELNIIHSEQKKTQNAVFSGGDIPMPEETYCIDQCLKDGAATYCHGWQELQKMTVSTCKITEADYWPTCNSEELENPFSTSFTPNFFDLSKTYVISACRSYDPVVLDNVSSQCHTPKKCDSSATNIIPQSDYRTFPCIFCRPSENSPTSCHTGSHIISKTCDLEKYNSSTCHIACLDYTISTCIACYPLSYESSTTHEPVESDNSPSTGCTISSDYTPASRHPEPNQSPTLCQQVELENSFTSCYTVGSSMCCTASSDYTASYATYHPESNESSPTCEPYPTQAPDNSPASCCTSHHTPSTYTAYQPQSTELDNWPNNCCTASSHNTPSTCTACLSESTELDNSPRTCCTAGPRYTPSTCTTCFSESTESSPPPCACFPQSNESPTTLDNYSRTGSDSSPALCLSCLSPPSHSALYRGPDCAPCIDCHPPHSNFEPSPCYMEKSDRPHKICTIL